MDSGIDHGELTKKNLSESQIWNPAFNEFKFGNSPEEVSSNLPKPFLTNWLALPQAFEYRHDIVKYFWLPLIEFGDDITKFIPPDVSINDQSYICFLFFDKKLFHISIRFFHDKVHYNYEKIVEAYAQAVNTKIIESEYGKEFYYDDQRILYFSCYQPERSYTCIDVILKDQTTSTDGHWFNLRSFHDQVPKSFIQPTKSLQLYKYDIMISYSHKDKEIVYQIYESLLDSKYKVWIDLENMYGPIVSRMAEAIENSQFVLLCMSDAYKSSVYCQLEAEYAFKFQSILIPLVVKKDFTQKGWLGMLCGLRLHIDFTKTTFDVAYRKLLSEISRNHVQTTSRTIHSLTHDQQQDKEDTKKQPQKQEKPIETSVSDDQESIPPFRVLKNEEMHSQTDIVSGYIISVTNEECQNGVFSLKYDSVINKYYRNGIEEENKLGWLDRVYSYLNIQRKVEYDLHMAYLCREKQGKKFSTGSISWLIQLDDECDRKYCFDRITLQYSSTTFDQHAYVQWRLCIGDVKSIDLPIDSSKPNMSFDYHLNEEESSIEHLRLRLVVNLIGSNDDWDNLAWQKAQLFRQSIDHSSDDKQPHQLGINITIVDRCTFYF